MRFFNFVSKAKQKDYYKEKENIFDDEIQIPIENIYEAINIRCILIICMVLHNISSCS